MYLYNVAYISVFNRVFIPRLLCLLCILLSFTTADERHSSGVWFTVEPEDVIIIGGSPALLNCQAATSLSSATPTLIWRTSSDQQAIDLMGDPRRSLLSNGSLYISRIEGGDEEYECVARVESVGSVVSRRAVVGAARLGPLQEQPSSLSLLVGQTAVFQCRAEGRPKPDVAWLKDQRPLALDETRMLLLPSGSLEIDEVEPSDLGTYRCNVSGLDRHRMSEKATLIVEKVDTVRSVIAPVFVTVPRPTVALEGSTSTLDCAANGSPLPWITWLKDGTTLDMADLDSRFSKVGTGSLQIRDVVESDAGNYQCRAENKEDSVDAQATLHVQVVPRFIKKPKSIVAMEKSDIELECEVYARPDPKVSWLKNGELIKQNNYIHFVNGNNLRILGLMVIDSGIFQCVATNPAGSIQASALLTVKSSERRYPRLPSTVTGEEGGGGEAPRELEPAIIRPRFVTLRWKPPLLALNTDILSYSVFYTLDASNRERVVNTSRSRLEEVIVSDLLPNSTYRFRVAALTSQGLSKSTPPIVVVTKPELKVPTSPQMISVVAGTTELLVKWTHPSVTYGNILKYRLYYFESDIAEEHHVDTIETQYRLIGLKRFTEYIVWVVAYNHNGSGTSSEEVTIRTLSDVPSEPPTNVTLEAASSTSVIVRWEPPGVEGQNGLITGYKLRYKLRGGRSRSEIVTAAGDRRIYTITGLERSSSYQVRLSAMNVNGTGPPTDWMNIETYENDLDESTVPEAPSSMRVKANSDSITVIWTPPKNGNIMVRDYIIGWGKGIPDEYADRLDGKQRVFVIKQLEANSEYVISLRAHNEKGNGPPIYENVRTRDEAAVVEPVSVLTPPVGLKATVLSSNTVVLFWTDTTLPYSQVVTDNRFYVVRWGQYHHSSSLNSRYRYHNSTVLNFMIDDLKPFTQYEFTVKLVKGRRESSWSMVVVNTTFEDLPGSPPKELTAVIVDSNPTSLRLSWQPPKTPNGFIIGYVVSYKTDAAIKEKDWITETIQGDKTTTTVKSLSLGTTYYFHVQARNSKGYSPSSATVSVTTPPGPGHLNLSPVPSGGGKVGGVSSTVVYGIGAGCAILVLVIVVSASIVCCKKTQESPSRATKGYAKGKGSTSNIKPPDLWIHHDQMELKNVDKANEGEEPSSTDTLEKHRVAHDYQSSNYMGSACQPLLSEEKTSTARRNIKLKPITLPSSDSSSYIRDCSNIGGSSGTAQPTADSRPVYPRTQYSISAVRAHVTVDPGVSENPYVVHPTTSVTYEPQTPASQSNYGSGDTKRLQGHPLKSFSVPAPPPQSAPTTPQQKHIVTVRPQGSSPYKKGSSSQYGASTSPLPSKSKHSEELPKIQPSYSTEELNQEMANLEGLMKDLNAITASEFEC